MSRINWSKYAKKGCDDCDGNGEVRAKHDGGAFEVRAICSCVNVAAVIAEHQSLSPDGPAPGAADHPKVSGETAPGQLDEEVH